MIDLAAESSEIAAIFDWVTAFANGIHTAGGARILAAPRSTRRYSEVSVHPGQDPLALLEADFGQAILSRAGVTRADERWSVFIRTGRLPVDRPYAGDTRFAWREQ